MIIPKTVDEWEDYIEEGEFTYNDASEMVEIIQEIHNIAAIWNSGYSKLIHKLCHRALKEHSEYEEISASQAIGAIGGILCSIKSREGRLLVFDYILNTFDLETGLVKYQSEKILSQNWENR